MEEMGEIFAIHHSNGWGVIASLVVWMIIREIKDFFTKKNVVVKNGNGKHAFYIKEFEDIDKHIGRLYGETGKNKEGIARLNGITDILKEKK